MRLVVWIVIVLMILEICNRDSRHNGIRCSDLSCNRVNRRNGILCSDVNRNALFLCMLAWFVLFISLSPILWGTGLFDLTLTISVVLFSSSNMYGSNTGNATDAFNSVSPCSLSIRVINGAFPNSVGSNVELRSNFR